MSSCASCGRLSRASSRNTEVSVPLGSVQPPQSWTRHAPCSQKRCTTRRHSPESTPGSRCRPVVRSPDSRTAMLTDSTADFVRRVERKGCGQGRASGAFRLSGGGTTTRGGTRAHLCRDGELAGSFCVRVCEEVLCEEARVQVDDAKGGARRVDGRDGEALSGGREVEVIADARQAGEGLREVWRQGSGQTRAERSRYERWGGREGDGRLRAVPPAMLSSMEDRS